MADLLMGVSHLLAQSPQAVWASPDLPTLVGQHRRETAAANRPQPEIAPAIAAPQFVATPDRLAQLQATASPSSAALDRLLETAPSRAIPAPAADPNLKPSGTVSDARRDRPAAPRSAALLSYATTPAALQLAEQAIRPLQGPRPGSGSQLYQQRQSALAAGTLYTRLAPDSFYDQWGAATAHPTYDQWRSLLVQEAAAIARGQGSNRLTVVVGDSLSQWLPPEILPRDRFWLNQGISGDTTAGVLSRLTAFAQTRPDTIHVMAGVNDLKNGASDAQILGNLEQIMQQLRQQHPTARIVIHSILPTRLAGIPSDRIRRLNHQIQAATQRQQVVYLDLHPSFIDEGGDLRYELTTDGLHLSRLGYQVWQIALLAV